jgi:hypothetical protein
MSMYTKQIAKNAADIITQPIITYLQTANPDKRYTANVSANTESKDVNVIRVKEKGSRKSICEISYSSNTCSSALVSNNHNVLPQEKLEDIMKDVNIQNIMASAAGTSRQESRDYTDDLYDILKSHRISELFK